MRRRLLVAMTALVVAACARTGGVVDAGAAPTVRPAPPAASQPAGVPPSPPSDDAVTGSGEPVTGSDRTPAASAGASAPASGTTIVTIHLIRGERLAAVTRSVPRVARIGGAAVQQLLAGPTPQEAGAGYSTQIPAGTRLRDLVITDGVATVDLSGEFEEGGGTLGLTLRLAQVVCTLDEFPTVDGVRLALDGTVVDVFSGDGVVIDEPVACADYDEIA